MKNVSPSFGESQDAGVSQENAMQWTLDLLVGREGTRGTLAG